MYWDFVLDLLFLGLYTMQDQINLILLLYIESFFFARLKTLLASLLEEF